MSYQNKYLKYKNKYLDLKKQMGGSVIKGDSTKPVVDIPSCILCLEDFNNTNRKPVALHNIINEDNVHTSNEHFYCLMCYNNPLLDKIKCASCRGHMNPNEARMCDFDETLHLIAKPFVSNPVPEPEPNPDPPTPDPDPDDDNMITQYQSLAGHTDLITSVAHYRTQDGNHRIVSGSYDRTIKIWNPDDGTCIHTLADHTDRVSSVAVEQGGDHRIVSCSIDGTIKIWNSNTGTCIRTLTEHDDKVCSVAVYGTGEDFRIISGPDTTPNSNAYQIKIWDPNTGNPIIRLGGHTGPVKSVAYYRTIDGEDRIVSGSNDRTVKIWGFEVNVGAGGVYHTLSGHVEPVVSVAHYTSHHGEDRIISGSYDHTIKIWEINSDSYTATNIHTLGEEYDSGPITSVAHYSTIDDEDRLVSGFGDGIIDIYDPNEGRLLNRFSADTIVITVAHYRTENGEDRIVSGGLDFTVKIWES